MHSFMSNKINEFKIFKSVVCSDPVSVVNVFFRAQLSAKMPRHDNTVLKIIAIAHTQRDVSIRPDKHIRLLMHFRAVYV